MKTKVINISLGGHNEPYKIGTYKINKPGEFLRKIGKYIIHLYKINPNYNIIIDCDRTGHSLELTKEFFDKSPIISKHIKYYVVVTKMNYLGNKYCEKIYID